MRLNEEHIRFGQIVFHTSDALRHFLKELKEDQPEFFAELGRSCDEFVEHCGFKEYYTRRRRDAVQIFLSYACGIIGTLYRANGNAIPPATVSLFKELKAGCDLPEKFFERFQYFCLVSREWAEYYASFAQNESFCSHGLGPLYAWAEAFIEAKRREEERAVESREIARRTETLLLDWIKDIDTVLPEGKKNIGEE